MPNLPCSPLLAEALTRNRGAVIDLDEVAPTWSMPATALGDSAQLQRWDPWVRSYLATQELIAPCRFVRSSAVPGLLSLEVLADLDAPALPWLPVAHLVRPSNAVFGQQVALVLAYAELREERMPEVLTQAQDTFSTWSALLPLDAGRLRRTRELLEVAVQMSLFIEMRFKHEFACWRPADLSWQVQPMIPGPGHGSLPSGHATEAYTVATVLGVLLGSSGAPGNAAQTSMHNQLQRLAARIATNRVVAGVHFPVDSVAGRLLGVALGEYFVARCLGQGLAPRAFDGTQYPGAEDFDPVRQPLDAGPYYRQDATSAALAASPVLGDLWSRAVDELRTLGLRLA